MLPTFVGIGTPRSGTTWLHELLDSHPDVAVSRRRKEVHFFDSNYDKGTAWYESFFPRDSEAQRYKAIGEITPNYFYVPEVPVRLVAMPSITHFFVQLRNPADRAFSHYVFRMRNDNYQGTFEQFLEDFPTAREWGFYAPNLKRFFSHIPRSRFLILIYEESFRDVLATRGRIAEFLGVDDARFPEQAGRTRVNRASIPRFRSGFHIASRATAFLRRHDMDWIPNLLIYGLGARRWFGSQPTPGPRLTRKQRGELYQVFRDEIAELEDLLQKDLSIWRMPEG